VWLWQIIEDFVEQSLHNHHYETSGRIRLATQGRQRVIHLCGVLPIAPGLGKPRIVMTATANDLLLYWALRPSSFVLPYYDRVTYTACTAPYMQVRQLVSHSMSKGSIAPESVDETDTAQTRALLRIYSVVVREAADGWDWVADHVQAVRPTTLRQVTRDLQSHWAPLAKRPIEAIKRADIAARLADITRDSGRAAATRARANLSALYGWAMREGLCEEKLGCRMVLFELTQNPSVSMS
jgi:hypothetical protein